jgi:dihydropteroate synthase
MAKDTFFSKPRSLRIRGSLFELNKPQVMGIINLTPDSFYQASRRQQATEALDAARKMIADGADMLDLGAYSSRPGAENISQDEELQRMLPALELIRTEFPDVIISIDTFRAEVAYQSVEKYKVDIINDISAGSLDNELFDVVAQLQVPYILMHSQGDPQTMQQNPHYEKIVEDICRFFADKLITLYDKGISDIILDPGFGFGKTIEHNYQLMSNLDVFRFFELPLLVGISRKSMIYKMLDITPIDALPGTIALNTFALMHGASILRVHDVKETVQTLKVVQAIQQGSLLQTESL